MSRTPEVVISTPRKFFHDLFSGLGGLTGVIALVLLFMGGNFIAPALVSALAFTIAANIKFRWVKRGEVGVYE